LHARLPFDGAMAFQAVDPLRRVLAPFVLRNDRGCLATMALGALARRFDEGGGRLAPLDGRTLAVDQEGRDDERCTQDHSDENGSETHRDPPLIRTGAD